MPCLAPNPERGRTIAAKPGSPMWMAMPEGTSWLSPGWSVSGASRQARRSSPAAPGVPYWGSNSRILGSRIFTSSLRKLALRFLHHARDVHDQLARELDLGAAAQRVAAAGIEQRDRIFIRAQRLLREVGGEQRYALFHPFLPGVGRQLLALGGEADAERRIFPCRDPGKDVRVLLQLEDRRAAVRLLDLLLRGILHLPVADRGDRHEYVAAAHRRLDLVEHLQGAAHVDPLHARGRGQCTGPLISVTLAP